jgi:hypothetical protein
VTVLADRDRFASRLSLVRTGTCALISIESEPGSELVAASGVSDGGPIEADALLAVCRVSDGAVIEHASTGQDVRIDVKRLLSLGTDARGVAVR